MRRSGVRVVNSSTTAGFLLHALPSFAFADFEIVPSLAAEHAGTIVVQDVSFDGSAMSVINGAELAGVNDEWSVQFLVPYSADAVPADRAAYILARIVNFDDFLVETPYSLVHAPIPGDDGNEATIESQNVSFNLSPLGDPATPSGFYYLAVFSYPDTKSVCQDEEPFNCFDEPYTEQDFVDWFYWNFQVDYSTYGGEIPITYDPAGSRSLTFEYVAGEAPNACAIDCFSNVLFLPGFQGSRLYQGSATSENQVWEPNSLQSDVQKLYLDQSGASINPIYTKAGATIDSVGPFFSRTDIYRTFLDQLTNMVVSDKIADFRVFPYDWRMSVDDIVENGTIYNDGRHYPAAELEELAAHSKTGKVTIIAHSNGGLLAKALMRKLEAEGKADLVDKIIFVGTPQLGTPKAVASILHGDFQNIPGWAGFLVSKANARALGENMPSAFGLLPSPAYFARVAEPVVDLSAAPALRAGAALANPLVDSAIELANFLTGAGGRVKPVYDNIEIPGVLSSALLGSATALHVNLDAWMPPSGVEVIQIAGWGLDTPKRVTYEEKRETFCSTITCLFATTTRHVVNMTEDGDGTVVSASAVATTTWPIFYIDIKKYNKDNELRNNHASMTEVLPIQELISILLATSSLPSLPQYVSETLPIPTADDKRLRLRILSPVSLDAYDGFGNHTGMAPNPIPGSDLLYKEENITNSYYEEFGEGKYLGLPAGIPYTIKLTGLGLGTFTFEITLVTGGVEGTTTSYTDIPVSASTTAVLTIGASGSPGSLALDQNGDGKTDTVVSSSQTTNPQTYVKLIITSVSGMDLGLTTKV